MEDKELWITFKETGSVVDYLKYKGIQILPEPEKIEERAFESDDNGNGNGSVRDTYR